MSVFRSLCFVMAAIVVSSCSDAPPPPPRPKASFARYVPFKLNIAYIDVVEEYKSSGKPPYVEQFFPTSPAQAMRNWAEERIRTVGQSRYMQVLIKDASVKETPLPRTGGVKGVFTRDQAQRYDARLDVEMRIYGDKSALSEASLQVAASRSATIGEDASPAEREALFARMTADLMNMVNAELEKNILAYFSNYIDYTPGDPARQ